MQSLRRKTPQIVLVLAGWLAAPAAAACAQDPLPGTEPLKTEGDLAAQMVEGIDQFLLQMTQDSVAKRARHWHRDTSSHEAYVKSVEPNRERLKKIIGVVDQRVPFKAPLRRLTTNDDRIGDVASEIRWPVLNGVDGEGVLIHKDSRTVSPSQALADVIAIHDPFTEVGATDLEANDATFELIFSDCRIITAALIDRRDEFSVIPAARGTNQPHREFIYRGAYEMGRHIIGYEVQKVLALVDWCVAEREARKKAGKEVKPRPIGVLGYGEGGLIALYAAAIDPRIDVVCVQGYFAPRENLWREPIYRNVWKLLDEFGDAEIASLVAPRPLIIEASEVPNVEGPPPAQNGRSGAAPGGLTTPPNSEVEREADRARQLTAGLSPPHSISVIEGRNASLQKFVEALGLEYKTRHGDAGYRMVMHSAPSSEAQFRQLVDFTQGLMRDAENRRDEFWKNADKSSIDTWQKSCDFYRKHFYDEVIGRVDQPLLPAKPRTRKVFDEPKYTGYEAQLDVFPGVFAYGILLLPKDIKPGERRPVVVCQHGLEGRPSDVADPKVNNPAYNQYACRLAERGFITYAPQNPYIGEDKFRTLQRKANPLKLSLFSFIVPQHQQATDWLASLPMVDPQRISFYGLSYGGKTAMRVPPLVDRYCLSICSADFNEWIWKNVSSTAKYSYLATGEYEMVEFDLGNTFNYAEMAGLIAPRPFMVERGHHDGVAPDEWVAYEYAKVRWLFAALKIPERTEIEFFDGPHSIHGVGTFDFLHRHLKWPVR